MTFAHALLPGGWAPDVRIDIDDAGAIQVVTPCAAAAAGPRPALDGPALPGAALPGMTDVHSHAFQRGFAGLTEFAAGGGDFWSWRAAMYAAAAAVEPAILRPAMARLAAAKLRGGYTSTVEFHYLQRRRDGSAYPPGEGMDDAIRWGAAQAGIGLTLLVSIYETAGFGGKALDPAQRRFRNSAAEARQTLADAQRANSPMLCHGLAPHSLRAVPPASLRTAIEGLDPAVPVHVHLAEQTGEVEACRAALGAAPVEWVLAEMPVDSRWCLIHATHASAAERAGIARAGAVVGLCPTTEANLGDGLFDLPDLLRAGGGWGIGADSNVCLDAFEELRLLEYGQRLLHRRRNLCRPDNQPHTGTALWQQAARGGGQASGRPVGQIAPGFRADFVVIKPTEGHQALGPAFWLDAAIFAPDAGTQRHVMVGGQWVVASGGEGSAAPLDPALGP